MGVVPNGYYGILGRIESGNDPNATSKTSSATGLYQFLKGTWEGLGFNWKDRFNVNTQNAAAQKFTEANASVLSSNGIIVDNNSLYAAHFLGAGTATKVFASGSDTPLSSILSSKVLNANSFLKGMDVGDFSNWLSSKTGATGEGGFLNSVSGFMNYDLGKPLGEALDSVNPFASLLNGETAARITAVIVGVILVGLAIAAFLFMSDAGKQALAIAKPI
jgi:hypothetical protein